MGKSSGIIIHSHLQPTVASLEGEHREKSTMYEDQKKTMIGEILHTHTFYAK